MVIIPELESLGQEDLKLKASLGYTVRLSFTNQNELINQPID
jgi:hypothetical protein